jgi:hypothetical protein
MLLSLVLLLPVLLLLLVTLLETEHRQHLSDAAPCHTLRFDHCCGACCCC